MSIVPLVVLCVTPAPILAYYATGPLNAPGFPTKKNAIREKDVSNVSFLWTVIIILLGLFAQMPIPVAAHKMMIVLPRILFVTPPIKFAHHAAGPLNAPDSSIKKSVFRVRDASNVTCLQTVITILLGLLV